MTETFNAECAICGTPYKACHSCFEQKTFTPWRAIVDCAGHYKIYLALTNYTKTKNREQAVRELHLCDLSNLESFKPEVKSAIKEILAGKDEIIRR